MASSFASPISSSQPPPGGWWARNWKWFVPMGCLTMFLLFFAFLAGIVMLVVGGMKNTDVYRQAMAKAASNPEVIQRIGTPLKGGWFVSGSINVAGDSGKADLTIPITGPKGRGTIYVDATKFAGTWEFQRLVVGVEGESGRINLLPGQRELEAPSDQAKPRDF